MVLPIHHNRVSLLFYFPFFFLSYKSKSPVLFFSPPQSRRPRGQGRREACACPCLADDVEQLGLENELALLVLLGRLVGLVVLPADDLVADAAGDVADDVAAGGHVTLARLGALDVDDGVEEVGLAVLAAEVLWFWGGTAREPFV